MDFDARRRDRITKMMTARGADEFEAGDPNVETLHAATFRAKKVADGKLRFVVAEKIGKAKVVTDVPETLAKKVWATAR